MIHAYTDLLCKILLSSFADCRGVGYCIFTDSATMSIRKNCKICCI